ncbi:putative disease resistance protein RGA1 isoform X2 [Spinacia oleracea]|uniref:Disease resistance protein RGA1 isoform X2 n=1 Tax=Spinacia oleracea TaxID=3562 RepID=A0A9R0K730_SPIOL|nr:putative disease resistance protein RGA1 isoform X2 [Spinacia oleracea]
MDIAGGLSIVQTVLQLLASPIWLETQSLLGVKSQHKKLKNTMSTIQNVLLDAEVQERLHNGRRTNVERGRLERLKEALYLADDLFDKLTTLAHRKQLMSGNNFSKEVSIFFSRFNQLSSAFTWSQEIKKIREMLDDIVKDHHHDFGLRHSVGLENNPRETHSFVCEEEDVIIGRNNDKKIIVDMLLDSSVEEDISFISIVGIGGLGKTTLAQLVYNDDRIGKEFPLKMWVCVSDDFNVKALVGETLVAVNPEIKPDGLNLEQLQLKLRKELNGKKYLLVLDDVWNEDCDKWRKLKTLLIGGRRGSRTIVTTRSKMVAEIVESTQIHELEGLSEENSWNLFERMALKPEELPMKPHLIEIGKEIVRKCANVPLAIRVVGSLLRGQGENRWQYLKNTDLANIKHDDQLNGIVPVLKISYYYLPFHLKNCFSYCAIFPKDYKIIKEDLICLWMAHGFIMSSDGESFEDVGEEYFKQLLQRCFFQDVERAEGTDEIVSCKMHDLIHDLAKEVSGTEILLFKYNTRCFSEKTLHIFIDRSTSEDSYSNLTKMKRMRSVLNINLRTPVMLSKVEYLRVLSLHNSSLKTLPDEIGKLLHLRFLDFSDNDCLSILPTSIAKLYNLQTLKLRNCYNLKELPRDLRKSVNLRYLDIQSCWGLTHMPWGMNSMTSLQKLTGFVLSGRTNVLNSGSGGVGELADLKMFDNHSDTMMIIVKKGVRKDAIEANGGGFLLKAQYLREISYLWSDDSRANNNSEALLQGLQPHPNIRKLKLDYYPGVRFPSWGVSSLNLQTCLPNLVQLEFYFCTRMKHLPLMGHLRHLKFLKLTHLSKVEYVN